jgi:tetratricopeptide (TPR) repeat protein
MSLFCLSMASCLLPPINTDPKYLEKGEFKELSTITEAKNLTRSGRLDKAEVLYRKLLKQNSKSLIPLNDLGYLMILEERFEEAEIFLKKVIKLEKNFIPARMNLARLYAAKNEFNKVIEQYDIVEDITSSYNQTELVEIIGENLNPDFNADLYRLKSSAHYLNGDFDEAVCSSEKAMALRAGTFEKNLHARLLMSLEKVDLALSLLKQTVLENQGNVSKELFFDYSLALTSSNEKDNAKLVLDKVLEGGNLSPKELAAAKFMRFGVESNPADLLVLKDNFAENDSDACKFSSFDVNGYWPYNAYVIVLKSQKELCKSDDLS